MITLILIIVVLGLFFDFSNGFHDTANAIATSLSTKALTPRTAIILAALLNLLGALMFSGVAKTIGGSIADPLKIHNGMIVVLAALISAIAWNLITWYFGIPSSSSHALIGSLAGAVISAAGVQAVNFAGFISIIEYLIVSPIIAFIVGYILMNILQMAFANFPPRKVNKIFRSLQVLSAAFQAFSHGTNDAQKTMGIITFALVAGGFQHDLSIPLWVKVLAAVAMGLGTSVGGWRIIQTVGTKIMKLEPINGFSADLSSSLVIIISTLLHRPLSTTHVISSSIMGVGTAKGLRAVKWGMAGRIVIAWVITLPITAILAGFVYKLCAAFQ
ncbi:inorganic phosphate transporter [Fodinisporobacter ferrooxydans]|uniref:Inorganic phosphate transporter n=1 Tax=Fodinisporobacter ferrooxydans TaxID=2901836 RepID=A0ABY4CHW9_9BACL|nr:inorganic phosphate transporter [Alicyclobacillaceae bacterium MYW30-H2]